ncbi:hypothetical protein FQN60_010781 [Etheostoma spectabile]|uniref:GCF C-terminal domain-containing protein n=1 Tax=Etheostoma spectabile TaxID=54343 RepID=A0A5J5DQD1_9PERO|nr:hypothetical protein FQN60_010781 [Etheostoma spectabile]
MIKKRITAKLDSLKEVHRARQAELKRMEGDVESAKTSAETLEESSSESQLKFYRAMTLFIHNLVECLREKVVEINSLELDLHSLLSGQMDALLAQRRQRTKEQADCLQQLSSEEDLDIPEDTQPSAEEEEQLQKKIADILLRSQTVFSDVQDEFSDDNIGDFENLPWFTAVETFCHGHGHEELEHTDRQTLSNIIEKTVLPKITAYVELVWDPMSRRQSVCLSDVCHQLKEDYSIFEGEQSKPVKALKEAVICRLRSCVDEDVPKRQVVSSVSLQRSTVLDSRNMGRWDLLLPEFVLKELMLDKLLNRYLMITVCSQTLDDNAVHACRKIADSLPLSWFKGENACLPQLQNFRNHLVQKVHTICKQQPPEDPNTRSSVVEMLQILSRIRCNDSIMAIAEKYHYEDVIYSHQLLNQDTA